MARSGSLAARLLCVLALQAGYAGMAAADVKAVVASGIGGDPALSEGFVEQAEQIAEGLSSLGSDASAVAVLHAPDRETLLASIDEAASADVDLFVLVLVGHGSSDSRTYRFNVPGPDPTTEDLVASLATVQARQQAIIVASSASGALLDTLAQPGRIVVTATRSGAEANLVRFPRFLAEAMSGTEADLDRNEILTLAEAWRYTTAAVAEYYDSESLLASEHPELRGDGSDRVALARLGSLAASTDDPVVMELLDQRLALETEFAVLRARKSSLERADYYQQLEVLLVQIAELQIEIDDATGWSESDAES